MNELCELGWLFKKVNDWLKHNVETSASMDVNQVTQALCFSIQSELNEYFRLMAILDSQKPFQTVQNVKKQPTLHVHHAKKATMHKAQRAAKAAFLMDNGNATGCLISGCR